MKTNNKVKVSMELRKDGLIVFNQKGNVYDLKTKKQINVYLGELNLSKSERRKNK